MYWGVPWAGTFGLGSPKLKVEVKNPKGNAPIPNDMWKPPSPNPKPAIITSDWDQTLITGTERNTLPEKPFPDSGSVLWPAGLGGTLSLGSCCCVLPLPYKGTTLSLLIAALQTGHTCLFGLVSSHWCKQGQLKIVLLSRVSGNKYFLKNYQNRWPHKLTTASLAVSRQILHSSRLSSFLSSSLVFGLSPPSPLLVLSFTSAELLEAIPTGFKCLRFWKRI